MKSQVYGLLISLICVTLFAWPVATFGAEGWEVSLKVSAATAENNLSFGQRADASMDVDGRYDVPAMLSGTLRAYFMLPEGQQLWRDIRPLTSGEAQTLNLGIETESQGQIISISWDQAGFPSGCRVELFDIAGQVNVDMLRQGSYVFTSDGGVRQFRLSIF